MNLFPHCPTSAVFSLVYSQQILRLLRRHHLFSPNSFLGRHSLSAVILYPTQKILAPNIYISSKTQKNDYIEDYVSSQHLSHVTFRTDLSSSNVATISEFSLEKENLVSLLSSNRLFFTQYIIVYRRVINV